MASNLVTLISSDNKKLEVDRVVVMESETVKELIEANRINEPILLPHKVQGDILAKVVLEYCKYHVESQNEIKAWDADFVKVDLETLIDITAAADYLKIKNLRDLTSQALVDMAKGKTADEIGEMFNIKNDFAPEEEAEIRRIHDEWASNMVTGNIVEEIRDMLNIDIDPENNFTLDREEEVELEQQPDGSYAFK